MKRTKILFCSTVVFLFLAGLLFFYDRALADVVEFKISTFGHPDWPYQVMVAEPWARKIERLSGERVRFVFYPDQILAKANEQYDAVLDGRADLAMGITEYHPGRFPLSSVLKLPFLGASGEKASLVFWHLYNKYLTNEFKDVKVLWLWCHGPGHLHTIDKPVRTLEDMKGLKIRVPDETLGKAIKLLGGEPFTCSINEAYELLKEHKLDGLITPWEGAASFKMLDFCKYHTELGMYTLPFFSVMNKQKYEALPADVQKIIDDNSGEQMSVFPGKLADELDARGRKIAELRGDFIYVLPKAEREKWKKITVPLGDEWVDSMNAKGLPGQAVLTYVVDLFIELELST